MSKIPIDSGHAFPMTYSKANQREGYYQVAVPGMSLRQYAAINLRVPNSGLDWLDAMIMESQRQEYAGLALGETIRAVTSNKWDYQYQGPVEQYIARNALMIADAMLAERAKGEE